jgi:hypothetical protein
MSEKQTRREREEALREWLGDSKWRWAYYRAVHYGGRVLLSLALLAVAYLLDGLVPRSVEVTATVVLMCWVRHADTLSRRAVARARERERLARKMETSSLLLVAGIGALYYAMAKGAFGGRK